MRLINRQIVKEGDKNQFGLGVCHGVTIDLYPDDKADAIAKRDAIWEVNKFLRNYYDVKLTRDVPDKFGVWKKDGLSIYKKSAEWVIELDKYKLNDHKIVDPKLSDMVSFSH